MMSFIPDDFCFLFSLFLFQLFSSRLLHQRERLFMDWHFYLIGPITKHIQTWFYFFREEIILNDNLWSITLNCLFLSEDFTSFLYLLPSEQDLVTSIPQFKHICSLATTARYIRFQNSTERPL